MYSVVYFVILLTTAILLLCKYMSRNNDYWKKRGVPFVNPMPFFGNFFWVYLTRQSIGDLTNWIYKKYKNEPYVGAFLCDQPLLVVRDLEVTKNILIKDFGNFIDRTMASNPVHDPMGSHILFVIQNPDWRPVRRKVSPLFTTSKMRQMYELMWESAQELLEYLDWYADEHPVIEVRNLLGKYTTDLISSVAFGVKANCFKDEDSPFRAASKRIFNWDSWYRGVQNTAYFIAPNLVRLCRFTFIDKFAATFLRNMFWETIRERKAKGIVRNDVIDVLLQLRNFEEVEDPCKLDGDILVAQAAQFFIAGYDTTSVTISFTLYELAKRPDIQEKLRQEVLDTLREHKRFTYDLLREMPYLDLVVKEALRKYPILPFLDRRCTREYKIPGHDLVIEEGTPVYLAIMGIHYDPEFYPDPDEFIPERFTEENVAKRPPLTYLPFGDGPRSCLGARFGMTGTKSAVAHILSKFHVEPCELTQKEMVCNPNGFLLAPINGIRLRFKKVER